MVKFHMVRCPGGVPMQERPVRVMGLNPNPTDEEKTSRSRVNNVVGNRCLDIDV